MFDAYAMVKETEAALTSQDLMKFRQQLGKVFQVRQDIEHMNPHSGDVHKVHFEYTEVMIHVAQLCYKAGFWKLSARMARRAQAWADDPMTAGNQRQFEACRLIQHNCNKRGIRYHMRRWRGLVPRKWVRKRV